MLHAPTNDRKNKAEASSKTAEHLPEHEQPTQLSGWIGRSRQSHPIQPRENLAALQKAYGNQAVLRMRQAERGRSSGKPSVTSSSLSQGGILQRKCACGNTASSSGTCAECQKKQDMSLQRKAQEGDGANEVPPIVGEVLNSPGQPLDTDTRAFMEPRFGHDFSQVRIHADGKAVESAQAVNALAYTVGQDIVLGVGQYTPGTYEGRKLLSHELTHVVQQKFSSTINSVQKLSIAPPNSHAEIEADAVAMRLTKGESAGSSLSHHPQAIQCQSPTGKCSNATIKNCTDEDLLTAICIGEVGNIKDRDGKKGVMNVVMNRVSDGGFGGNVRAVATASGQFHGLRNGINLLNNSSFVDCRSLAQEVIATPSDDPTAGAVFFDQSCAKSCEQYCTVYLGDGKTGAHYFARRATPSEKKHCQDKKTNPSGVNRYCCDNPKQRVYVMPLTEIVGSVTKEDGGEENP